MKRKKLIWAAILTASIVIAGAGTYYLLQANKKSKAHGDHSNMESMRMPMDSSQNMEGMVMEKGDQSMEGVEKMKGMNMGEGSDHTGTGMPHDIAMHTLFQPTNSYVLSTMPVTRMLTGDQNVDLELLGFTAYNTSTIGSVAARITGRIEKLYVQYRFQKIEKGQKVMEIYSPELLTGQQNLLYLIKNDSTNTTLINSAKERLLLLGFPANELTQIIRTGKPLFTVTVYSNYSGHIHEAGDPMGSESSGKEQMDASQQIVTQELTVKVGKYVQKGQSIFRVYDPNKLWALLNVYPLDFPFVKEGTSVLVQPEGYSDKSFKGTIYYLEPFFRPGNRTVTARINISNEQLKLPVGIQLRAKLLDTSHKGDWLPKESVISLGLDKVVFVKVEKGFRVQKIETGVNTGKMIQVVSGITEQDSVAANAQFLVDSESFIKIKK